MPARLIINADDFGLTTGINRAIGELHAAGVITSTTFMANGPAFEDAVSVAHAHPTLGIGCHIVLTDGVPISPLRSIPSLLGPNKRSFRPGLADFVQALLRGKISSAEIEREALAQIDRLQRAGLAVTHFDTHKHTHLFPAVARPLLKVAERTGIRAIRNPFEPPFALTLAHGTPMRRFAVRALARLRPRFEALPGVQSGRVLTTDGTLAISATGDLTSAALFAILHALPPAGTYELCCHPGYDDSELDRVATRLREHRNTERKALLTEVPPVLAQPGAPALVHYGGLSPLATKHSREIERD